MQVTRKCKLKFVITANFIDEVELDVVSLDTCGIVLGSLYLYDRRAIFHRHENKYHLFKNGIEYIVRAHRKKMSLSLMPARQMKRIVNASQNFALLIFKHQVVVNEAFQGNASNEKFDFIKVANGCNKLFQSSNMFPPKRSKQDEEKLQ